MKTLRLIGLACLAGLYFTNLSRAGVFHWDAAYFSNEAESGWQMLSRTGDFLSHRKTLVQLQSEIKSTGGGIFPTGAAKPTYVWLLALFHGLVGMDGFFVTAFSVLFGLLGIVMVYLLGCQMEGPETGVLSAVLLGCRHCIFIYRAADTPLGPRRSFFLAGLYLLLNNRFFLAGLSMGLAYTSHYGILPNLALLGASLIGLDLINKDQAHGLLRKYMGLGLGFLAVPIGWEVAYRLVDRIAGPFPPGTGFNTYFYYLKRQMSWNLPASSSAHYTIMRGYDLLRLYRMGQGIPFVVILLVALGYCAWKLPSRRRSDVFVLVSLQGLVLSVFWVLNPATVVIRVVEFVLPFQALMIGSFLASFQNRWVKLALISAFLTGVIPRMRKPLRDEAAYASAVHFLNSVAVGKILTLTEAPPWRYALGPGRLWNWGDEPLTQDRLRQEVRKGTVRYAALGYKDFFMLEGQQRQIASDIRTHLKPVAVFPNPMACDPLNVMDEIDADKLASVPEACFIEIYDIKAGLADKVL